MKNILIRSLSLLMVFIGCFGGGINVFANTVIQAGTMNIEVMPSNEVIFKVTDEVVQENVTIHNNDFSANIGLCNITGWISDGENVLEFRSNYNNMVDNDTSIHEVNVETAFMHDIAKITLDENGQWNSKLVYLKKKYNIAPNLDVKVSGHTITWKYKIDKQVFDFDSIKYIQFFTSDSYTRKNNMSLLYKLDTSGVTAIPHYHIRTYIQEFPMQKSKGSTIKELSFQKKPIYKIDYKQLDNITNAETAITAVANISKGITQQELENPDNIELILNFSEQAIENANKITVINGEINLTSDLINQSSSQAVVLQKELTKVLETNNITSNRELFTNVKINVPSGEAKVNVDKSFGNTEVDNVVILNNGVEVYINKDLSNEDLTVSIPKTEFAYNYENGQMVASVKPKKIGLSKELKGKSITVGVDKIDKDDKNQSVFNENGENLGGKVNPNTNKIETPINKTETLTVKEVDLDFSDIKALDKSMQEVLIYLKNKGRINGTTDTEFSPDKKITRAEFATMLLKALSKDDINAGNGGFKDVKQGVWYYNFVGASKNAKMVTGYEDNTFKPEMLMPREQLIAVSSRALSGSVKLKAKYSLEKEMNKFTDNTTISSWAKNDIAYFSNEGLVTLYTNESFSPKKEMTRAEAALIIYGVYKRIN